MRRGIRIASRKIGLASPKNLGRRRAVDIIVVGSGKILLPWLPGNMNSEIVALARSNTPWFSSTGQHVAIASRIRLVRDLVDERFPCWASNEQQIAVLERMHGALCDMLPQFRFWRMENLSKEERGVFCERRIAGKGFAKTTVAAEVAVIEGQSMAFRFNDGDHIKISCLLPGQELMAAYERADVVDNALSQRLEFAFDKKKGFLTSDPSDMGTGLRASLLLFLPALSAAEKIGQITHAVQQLGCAVGGFFGIGSGFEGCIFQLYNRITLGESEETILRRMVGVGETVVEQELAARSELEGAIVNLVADRMARVMAMLFSARVVTLQEGLALLGQARLAACLGYVDEKFMAKIDELMTEILPIHLQLRHGEWVDEARQNVLRADVLRQAFANVQLLR